MAGRDDWDDDRRDNRDRYEGRGRRADYGGYEPGASGYPTGPGRPEIPRRLAGGRRPDDSIRPDYREREFVADDDISGGLYSDYEPRFGPYAGGGYPPDERGDLRARRGWSDRIADEVRSWFGNAGAERRLDWDMAARGHNRGRGPKGYQRSDERIRDDVSDRLTDDPVVDASDIEVTVSGGEVTLSGVVASRVEKRRAEDCADSVSGVRQVQNNLRVGELPQSGTLGAHTDPRIAAVSQGKEADKTARDIAEDRNGPRLGALRPDA